MVDDIYSMLFLVSRVHGFSALEKRSKEKIRMINKKIREEVEQNKEFKGRKIVRNQAPSDSPPGLYMPSLL